MRGGMGGRGGGGAWAYTVNEREGLFKNKIKKSILIYLFS